MNKLALTTLVLFGMPTIALGTVSTRVCEADGNTPFDGRDIMVGTNLTIIVSSDVSEYWGSFGNDGGSLAIEEEYWDYGILSARGPQVAGDWAGSHLLAAGNEAFVCDWEELGIDGFDLYTGSTNIEAGDWFIIDYTATKVGICKVGFYEHRISWFDPIYYISFSTVPEPATFLLLGLGILTLRKFNRRVCRER
jgi:hypothetical protein